MDVTGSPQLAIDMDPAEWGKKQAAYHSGGGSSTLTFTHTVVEPNISTQGIAVLANTLALNGGTIKSASSQTNADLSHAGLGHDSSHKVDWEKSSPAKEEQGNNAPVCTATEPLHRMYAPPLETTYYTGLDCSDPDGDELTFTVSSDPAGVTTQMGYESSLNRVWYQTLGHCDLEDIVPALPGTFTATVTVTATDPYGASATGKAYFSTAYKMSFGVAIGCPNPVGAEAGYTNTFDYNKLTLTFDVELDEGSTPAASDFVVKVNGEAAALAETGAVKVDENRIALTLAEAVSESPTITVSYTPGDSPIRSFEWGDGVDAEAFEDYPVKLRPASTRGG